MKLLSALFLCLGVSGCSLLGTQGETSKKLKFEKVWVRSTLQAPYFSYRRVHRMKPLIIDDIIIAGNSVDGLVAYEKSTAKEIWRKKIVGGVESGIARKGGFIYFGAGDGFFYKVEAMSGIEAWSFPIRAEGLGQPTLSGNSVYFVAGNNIIYSLDITTGKSNWLYNRRDPSNISIRGGSRPSIDDSRVYVGFSDGALVALNKSTGSLLWETVLNTNKRFQDIDSQPLIDKERLYVAGYDHSLSALSKKDGTIIWQLENGGYSSPSLKNSQLYYTTTDSQLVRIDKESGKRIWNTPLKTLGTKPVFWKDFVVTGEFGGALKFFKQDSGQLVGQWKPGRGIHSETLILQDTGELFFMSADGNLFYLKAKWIAAGRDWPWEEL